ncbi:MAG TPA: family 20 glycosylhydrolase [Bacteroidia bacterium]|jgi:hexosaminidase|nr:family 20 glycosylhydrolase [Bacteroidia bacterium]
MKQILKLLFFLCVSSANLSAQYDAARYPIIPKPYKLLPFDGQFDLNANTVIVTDNKFYKNEIDLFLKKLKDIYAIDLKYVSRKVSSNFIYISEDSTDVPTDGYDLFINRNEINIYGGHSGIFYALQSLFQLIHRNAAEDIPYMKQFYIPACSVVDQPRFAWRGMHLDVSRHFYTKENVKEYLEWMAMYKLNVFHWHLTDDQGWRIEIKKYPKLTSVGAWRKGTLIGHEGWDDPPLFDTITYGGFYTQADIKEILSYAASLHITVVPEIEMPGHSSAILAAYPEYGCTDDSEYLSHQHFTQPTWGVFDDVLCPNEKTLSFLDDILKEVCALFPGKYIHIGGDECPKAEWKGSAMCQDIMKKNNLKDENELQSWFTKQIVSTLKKYGKEAIGWDEILEGGLADGAAVMSWRGEEGGIAAAKAKHDVVMSPGGWCYFDHYQSQNSSEPLAIGGYLPLNKVYEYDPVPASLDSSQRKYIMGVQANLWTEYIGSWSYVQYMLFPRICALAEVAWTISQEKEYTHFENRVIEHMKLLDAMKINYAKSIYDIDSKIISNTFSGLSLELNTKTPGAIIKYWLDGDSAKKYNYDYPVTINRPIKVDAALFKDEKMVSSISSWNFTYNLATGKPITLRKQPNKSYPGEGAFTLVDGIEGRTKPWLSDQWLGFCGDTLDAIIDLGKDTSIMEICVIHLRDHGSWIYGPHACKILGSVDGVHYSTVQGMGDSISVNNADPDTRGYVFELGGLLDHYRYIRVIYYPQPKIPSGNPGEGNPAWLFVSEIEVY